MSNETWMNAKKAVELGFADEVLYDGKKPQEEPEGEDKGESPEKTDGPVLEARMYSSRMMDQTILNRLRISDSAEEKIPPSDPVIGMDGKTEDGAVPYQILRNQLEFLK